MFRHSESSGDRGRKPRVARAAVQRDGFVLVAVLFSILVMSVVAFGALVTADDERRTGFAMRQSSTAFFAAESGIREQWANLSPAAVGALNPGDTLASGWRAVGSEAEYRSRIIRLDGGGSEVRLFALEVDGRARGQEAGWRQLAWHFTRNNGVQKFDAAAKIRGRTRMDNGTSISGIDVDPPEWTDDPGENRCDDITHEDKIGLMMQDTSELDMRGSSEVDGDPRGIRQDSMINDATFESSGQLDWSELAATAEHTIGCSGCGKLRFQPRATTTVDSETGAVICDRSDPYNWGSSDPTHPCYNYFPVIKIVGDGVLMERGDEYAQAIIIVEGAELDIENPMTFAGIIMSKGCHEIDDEIYGAIVHDEFPGAQCAASERGLYLDDATADLHYSTCAITRALEHSAAGVVLGSSWDLVSERAFHQVLTR